MRAHWLVSVGTIVGCGGGSSPSPVGPQPTPVADEQPAPAPTAPAPTEAPKPPPPPTCTAAQILEDSNCVDVAVELQGMRWEMPCKPHKPKADACGAATEKQERSVTLGGTAGVAYDVTLRFRGVVEQMSYTGGTAEDSWYIGGKPANKAYNVYALVASAPAQRYFLNAGKAGIRRTFAIDYTKTIRVEGGAKLTLTADAQDGQLITNHDERKQAITVADAPPTEPFDGQFIQMDVVSVARAR